MKFRKKPVLVDAVQYTPGLEDGYACYVTDGGRFLGYYDKATVIPYWARKVPAIKTLGGFREISADDWIITGVAGERYPCKAEIFAQTYEAAEGPPHEDEAHALIEREYRNAVMCIADPAGGEAQWDSGCVYGIEFVLNTLGIKIEGVNADDNAN